MSTLELKLQETAFEVLEQHDRHRSRRHTLTESSVEDWNEASPALYHHRERIWLNLMSICSN